MTFVSYAQNLEDVVLWRALRGVGEAGFYIDVGAWDPEEDSVSRAFYERNWRGVNVEPDEVAFAALQAARPRDVNLRIALGREKGEATFYRIIDTGLSTLDPILAARHRADDRAMEQTKVGIDTLAQICCDHVAGDIHFLKIDVEGAEAAVLAGADFERYRPWIVLVEATRPNSQQPVHHEWEPALLRAGYVFAYFDGLNRFYVAREHDELMAAFHEPPNVFDDYISVAGLKRLLRNEVQVPGMTDIVAQARSAEASAAARAAAELAAAEALAQAAAAEARAAAEADARAGAEARATEAEARALAGRRDVLLLQADLARHTSVPVPAARTAASGPDLRFVEPQGTEIATLSTVRVFYDASSILDHGFLPPVGLVRAEHYVAEFLAKDPSIQLHFVVYDRGGASYRPTTDAEDDRLRNILFRRYDPELGPLADPDASAQIAGPAPLVLPPDRVARLLFRIDLASRMSPADFAAFSAGFVRRRFPITADRPVLLRIGKRVARRGALIGMRLAHRVQAAAVQAQHWLGRCAAADKPVDTPQPTSSGEDRRNDVIPVTGALPSPGDVLISMASLWDYMDYAYLDRLCRRDGVRLVSVIYDVIAMELPFITYGPPHIYHRHWVEIGHLSSHLLAISQYSVDSYRRFIAEPNDLPVSISHAYLPNFLKERAAEIGEVSVAGLDERPFVLYCSTIETRKNHQLLLHIWDRLRQDISPERMPILVLVGKWGWGTEMVRLLAERNWRLRSHLRVLDRVSDAELIWLYRNARFSAFPSYSEGFGLAAAESLSFGTPVVVSDCPALVEASEGLMPAYPPHDFPAWYEEIRRLVTDDAKLEELRAAVKRYRGPAYNEFGRAMLNAVRKAAAPVRGETLCRAA